MVGGQYRHGANDQQGLVENKNISMKFCINTAHFCLDNFYVKKCHMKALLDILIFHLHEVVYQFQCQKISDLLCMKFTYPKNNDPLNVSAFDFIYNHVRRFFRFPQNNIRQYSCITLIKMQCETQP